MASLRQYLEIFPFKKTRRFNMLTGDATFIKKAYGSEWSIGKENRYPQPPDQVVDTKPRTGCHHC